MNNPFHIHIDTALLDVQKALDFVADENAGGIAVFVGTTRRYTGERETSELFYEAYEEMALSEMRSLARDAVEHFGLTRAYLAHRLGVVAFKEASVLIAVSSPHRDAAFKACRWLIDEVKHQVPIWKKERYADGGEEWVEGMLPVVPPRNR